MERSKAKITAAIAVFILYLASAAFNALIIEESINHKISYYYGSLWFLPTFIVSYWLSLLVSKTATAKGSLPKLSGKIICICCDVLNIAVVICWVAIYFIIPEAQFYERS